jgi:uncharacterized protein YicC (UPF0701 family)
MEEEYKISWQIKMGKLAEIALNENLIKSYQELEGDVRIKYDNKVIMTITYSQTRDVFHIHKKDTFREEHKSILENLVKEIKSKIDKNQKIFIFQS